MNEFVEALEAINATEYRPFIDDRMIVNISLRLHDSICVAFALIDPFRAPQI